MKQLYFIPFSCLILRLRQEKTVTRKFFFFASCFWILRSEGVKIFKHLIILLLLSLPLHAKTIALWPKEAPGDIDGEIAPESIREPTPGKSNVLRIQNVSNPSITLYPVSPNVSNGTAILVCPGGGYNILAYEHEGTEVCQWLNQIGVTGIILKYRVPRRTNREKHAAPLQDAQRAMGIIRKRADDWGIDPKKIGILGFSAGGNLAMMALTNFEKRTYSKIDQADEFSCRPDFGILIYPAYLVDRVNRNSLFPEIRITKRTPPCFFAHTGDDPVPAEGSVLAYLELEKLGIIGNELHVYPYGGHGYGIRDKGNPVSRWPDRAEEWLRSNKWIETEN